jgi:Transposase IS66 family
VPVVLSLVAIECLRSGLRWRNRLPVSRRSCPACPVEPTRRGDPLCYIQTHERLLSDGRIEIDSNTVKRPIRSQTITRKHTLFAASNAAAGHRHVPTDRKNIMTSVRMPVHANSRTNRARLANLSGMPIFPMYRFRARYATITGPYANSPATRSDCCASLQRGSQSFQIVIYFSANNACGALQQHIEMGARDNEGFKGAGDK